MARSGFAGGTDGLQIFTAAVNMLK